MNMIGLYDTSKNTKKIINQSPNRNKPFPVMVYGFVLPIFDQASGLDGQIEAVQTDSTPFQLKENLK